MTTLDDSEASEVSDEDVDEMINTRKVILSKPADWDIWFSFVKAKAINHEVWELINSAIEAKSVEIPKSTSSIMPVVEPEGLNKNAVELYKLECASYTHRTADYQNQKKTLIDLINYIQKIIIVDNVIYIRSIDSHSWNQLRALKKRLASTDSTRTMIIETKYRQLCWGSTRYQDMKTYLTEWERTYIEAKKNNLFEISGNKALRDFLVSLAGRESQYSNAQLMILKNSNDDLLGTIASFRQFIRMRETENHKLVVQRYDERKLSAFSVENNQGSTFNEQPSQSAGQSARSNENKEKKSCLCESMHRWGDCYYMIPEKRPNDWTSNHTTMSKVNEALKDQRLKSTVEKSIKNNRKRENKGNKGKKAIINDNEASQKDAASSNQLIKYQNTDAFIFSIVSNIEVFTISITSRTALSTVNVEYSLKGSWILDEGANHHVCNSTMLSRFTKTRNASDEKMTARAQHETIDSYEIVTIFLKSPTDLKTMTLENVAYISNFMTNLIAQSLLKRKGLCFDDWKMHLHVEDATVVNVQAYDEHYLLENNTSSSAVNQQKVNQRVYIAAKSIKSETAYQWHQLMTHASSEVIQHLKTSAEEEKMKITDKSDNSVLKTHECESCALSKMHKIIFRSAENVETSDKSFFRVTYDLIQLGPAFNKNEWVSHFACHAIDFNLVFTHEKKSDASRIVREAVNLIETRFNFKVVFIRSDEEKFLGADFKDFLVEKGISFEPFAPDSLKQNGHFERKGGILAMKARVMRIDAGLLNHLWPEIIRTTDYIANRTLMKKHQWKTSYELVLRQAPNLNNLHLYECKVYALNKHISKKAKLQERAHIDHLIDYEARNIFRIWISSQRKVIRTRDVIFDENSKYDSSDVDLIQVIIELMLDTTFESQNLDPIISIVEVDIWKNDTNEELIHPSIEDETDQTINQTTSQSKGKGKEVEYLPSSSSSNAPTSRQSDVSSESEAPPTKETKKKKMIELDIDTTNIIPEGMRRRRAARKQAYLTVLKEIADDEITSFHTAFSAMSCASAFYNHQNQPATKLLTKLNLTSFHRDSLPPEPKNFRQMQRHPHAVDFNKAILTEISALRVKSTWKEIPINEVSKEKVIIPIMLIFKYKFDENGFLIKYKARLMTRGDMQHTNQNTYAVTLATRIFRALMTLTAAFNLETRQFDAMNAFVNSLIDEPTYCRSSENWSYEIEILLLKRALYELKQSPALWYRHLFEALITMNFESVSEFECLFISQDTHLLLFFFVNDIVLLYDKRYSIQADEFQMKLFNRFEMKCLGKLKWFLRISITRDRASRKVWLFQESYVEKLINKFNISLDDKAPDSSLFSTNQEFENQTGLIKYQEIATPQQIQAYQQRVGFINFAAVITRSNVTQTAFKLSKFLINPSKFHMKSANRILKYLRHTKKLVIEFNNESDEEAHIIFLASSDASFVDDIETRFSSQEYAFKLFNELIDWKTFKQRTVITSFTEIELLIISVVEKELIWWQRLFEIIHFQTNQKSNIQCDN
jgi:hypothetical protein